jgi:histone-lysine N-methyltransferase EZH2
MQRIVEEEAERRGTYYDKVGHSFLFDLAEGVAVDAALKGNRTRFANHSKTACNVYSRCVPDSNMIGD